VQPLPHVALFALGGTIAAPVDSAGRNASMTLGADELVGDLAGRAGVTVSATTFRRLPSASIRFADLLALSRSIGAALSDGATGAVVTVGTDSLEEIAYALDLLHGGDEPIVVTGAMRNAGLPGADGPANLLGALRVATHPFARGQGVLVVMNDEIHLARFVSKAHSSSVAAFRSAGVGPVGWLVEDRVRIPLLRRSRPDPLDIATADVPTAEAVSTPVVSLLRLSLDDDPEWPAHLAQHSDAMVVEVFGAGHAPERSMDALRTAAQRIPVVFASRTGAGELYRSTGSFPGSEQDLLAGGLISAGSLDGVKSRVLLSLLLQTGLSGLDLRNAFADYASA
jgi:L-asparaginase